MVARVYVQEQLEVLAKAGLITGENMQKATEALEGYWEDKYLIVWEADDVLSYEFPDEAGEPKPAGELYGLTREDAINILGLIEHDAGLGVTWLNIEQAIEEYIENREKGDGKNTDVLKEEISDKTEI